MTAAEEFAAALALDNESAERWALIAAIQRRGDEATYREVVTLLGSADLEQRDLAVDVLAQFGAGPGTPPEASDYRDRTAELLLPLLDAEREATLLASLVSALGHLDEPRALARTIALRAHPDEDLRFAVACRLGGEEDAASIEALIELTADVDADVRDWATFGLGVLGDVDTPAVRDALVARLADDDVDTREEALVGLGRRGDVRAMPALLAALDSADPDDCFRPWDAAIELALRTAAPELRPWIVQFGAEYTDEPAPPTLSAALAAYNL